MQNWKLEYEKNRDQLIKANAYNPADEHDACGVGLVASIDGKPRREIVELAIKSLKNVWHRGAVDADGKSGDGAGIQIEIAPDFFKEKISVAFGEAGVAPYGVPSSTKAKLLGVEPPRRRFFS